jgi:hypothetical protein
MSFSFDLLVKLACAGRFISIYVSRGLNLGFGVQGFLSCGWYQWCAPPHYRARNVAILCVWSVRNRVLDVAVVQLPCNLLPRDRFPDRNRFSVEDVRSLSYSKNPLV